MKALRRITSTGFVAVRAAYCVLRVQTRDFFTQPATRNPLSSHAPHP